jgi:hypothetical protein
MTSQSKIMKHVLAIFGIGLVVASFLCQGCVTSAPTNRYTPDDAVSVVVGVVDNTGDACTKGFMSSFFTSKNTLGAKKVQSSMSPVQVKEEEGNSHSDKKVLLITKYKLYADKALLDCNAFEGQSITVLGSEDFQRWEPLVTLMYKGEFFVPRPSKGRFFWRLHSDSFTQDISVTSND